MTVLYGFSLAYLVAPSTFSSANIIEFAAGLPEWVKVVEKTILAAPFAFHSLNGLRHLAWDTGKCQLSHAPFYLCDRKILKIYCQSSRSREHIVRATLSLVQRPFPRWHLCCCRGQLVLPV